MRSCCWHIIDRKTRECVGYLMSSTPEPGDEAVACWLEGEGNSYAHNVPNLYERYCDRAWELEAIAHEEDPDVNHWRTKEDYELWLKEHPKPMGPTP